MSFDKLLKQTENDEFKRRLALSILQAHGLYRLPSAEAAVALRGIEKPTPRAISSEPCEALCTILPVLSRVPQRSSRRGMTEYSWPWTILWSTIPPALWWPSSGK